MTVNHFPLTPLKDFRRDGNGRPFVKQPDGREISYRRVTTFIDVLDDEYLISMWRQRMVALGMASRHDLVMEAASLANDPDGNKDALNKVVDAAREYAGDTVASRTGTAVHAITHQIDRGITPLIPPAAKPDLNAYQALLKREGLEPVETELQIVLDDLRVAGTADRIYQWQGHRIMGDIKTGSLYGGAKMERQLACYAGGKRYNLDTGERTDLNVNQDRGLIIWIPAGQGKAEIRWANLERGRYGMALCDLVWQDRGTSAGALMADPPRFDLFQAIAQAEPSSEAFNALWAAHKAAWTDEATQAARARIEAHKASQTPSAAPVV